MRLARFRKQPAETRKYVLDYSQRLTDGNVLTAINSVIINPATGVTPLIIVPSISTDGLQVVLYVSDGDDRVNYKVDILVEITDPLILWEDEIIFLVENT